MIVMTRDELKELFNKCGSLAQYHIEAGKVCFVCNRDEVDYHLNMTDHYIAVRQDIIRILTDGTE